MASKVRPIVDYVIRDEGWRMVLRAMLSGGATSQIEAGLLSSDSQIAEYGYYNEFGVPKRNIPERSFIRSTFDENRDKYERAVERAMRNAQTKGTPLRGAFLQLGTTMVNDIKRKITKLRTPINKASTVARKGSSNPLIDTGAMRNAIRWKEVR